MKIAYQKIVTYEVDVTQEEFVNNHLVEIHLCKNKDNYEYDFYVRDRINNGMLLRQFTLSSDLFDIDLRDFKTGDWTKQDNDKLVMVLKNLPSWEDLQSVS